MGNGFQIVIIYSPLPEFYVDIRQSDLREVWVMADSSITLYNAISWLDMGAARQES